MPRRLRQRKRPRWMWFDGSGTGKTRQIGRSTQQSCYRSQRFGNARNTHYAADISHTALQRERRRPALDNKCFAALEELPARTRTQRLRFWIGSCAGAVVKRTAGALRLPELGLLAFNGPDAAAFLQGYLTNDMAALEAEPTFTALCNLKGRALLTGYVWRAAGAAAKRNAAAAQSAPVLLLLHRTLRRVIPDFLRPYLAFSKAKASDVTDDHAIFGAIGLGLAPPALNLDHERQLVVLAADQEDGAQSKCLREAPVLTSAAWRTAAIQRREVWLQADTSGKFLPQMLALDQLGAVSFTKGCYLGQEVVARAQHRGAVKRRLMHMNWSGAPLSEGEEVTDANGKAAGAVVMAATAASETGGCALAVINRSAPAPYSARQGRTKLQPA